MSNKRWPRHTDEDVAIDALLDAAGRAFADLGVAKASMVDICRYAGCSRATLYRYFANQRELHFAFVHRATLRIGEAMAAARGAEPDDPATVLADRIVRGLRAVRTDPMLAVWFEPENVAVPPAVSQDSEVLQAGAAAAIDALTGGHLAPDELTRRGAWMMRSIVSFLALPAPDDATERDAIESFVVPVLIADRTTTGSQQ